MWCLNLTSPSSLDGPPSKVKVEKQSLTSSSSSSLQQPFIKPAANSFPPSMTKMETPLSYHQSNSTTAQYPPISSNPPKDLSFLFPVRTDHYRKSYVCKGAQDFLRVSHLPHQYLTHCVNLYCSIKKKDFIKIKRL